MEETDAQGNIGDEKRQMGFVRGEGWFSGRMEQD